MSRLSRRHTQAVHSENRDRYISRWFRESRDIYHAGDYPNEPLGSKISCALGCVTGGWLWRLLVGGQLPRSINDPDITGVATPESVLTLPGLQISNSSWSSQNTVNSSKGNLGSTTQMADWKRLGLIAKATTMTSLAPG